MTEKFVYPLAEVAELTGWAELSLLRDCRAGRIEHVHRGNAYGMTRSQIDKVVAEHTRATSAEPTTKQVEDAALEAVRKATLGINRGRGAA